MRPLELDLTSFRSYDRQTIDLRPHELVVITGDTGAGKTSLLDAISFAIFGRTPEQGSSSKDLLTLGRDHGEVRLTFGARGEVWRVTRRYGARAPEPRLLLERLADDDGAPLEAIAGAEAVGARLEAVVGMGFRAFTSAVLLAQGRFAEFLTAKPADRDAILRELFGVASLEGARAAAQAAEAAAQAEAGLREGDAARLPAHDASARAAAARQAREAATAHARAARLRPIAERVARLGGDAARAEARRAAADEAAAGLLDPAASAALGADLVAARRGMEDAETERARRTEDHARALGDRDAARARHGGGAAELAALRERAERAARLSAELPARERALADREVALAKEAAGAAARAEALAAAEAEHARLSVRADLAAAWRARCDDARGAAEGLAGADAAMSQAAGRLRAAEATNRQAAAARERAQLHDLAAAIRAGLAPGEPCPVCGAAVAEHADEAPELAAAEKALAAARRELAEATGEHAAAVERRRTAQAAADSAEAARDAAASALADAGIAQDEAARPVDDAAASERGEAVARLRAEAQEHASRVREETARVDAEREAIAEASRERDADRAGLGRWAEEADPVAALTSAITEVHAREEAADAAGAAASAAGDAAARAGAALAALERGPIAALRAAAARAAERGRLEAPGDDATPEELIAAAGRLRETALAAARTHAGRAAAAAAAAEEARAALAAAAPGIERPEQVEPAVRRRREACDAARAALGRVEEVAATARRLAAEAAAARARSELHHQVALDLRANAFPRYLLSRYRERLAVGASEHLQALSAGAYRFSGAEPDPMAVVDTRRGERLRPAGTLSGGERFLASLALALGLGDVAAESSGRLDCLFLDEGFSTLDAESLEQALAGVERLAGDGRLVGVITHLPGVAERLGAEIRVAKDPEGVSRIVQT